MKNNNLLIPETAQPTDEKVLAYGEVTGHSHALQGAVGRDFQIYTIGGVKFCELKTSKVELRHEEHEPQILRKTDFPQGIEINIVREYDHFEEEARNVID